MRKKIHLITITDAEIKRTKFSNRYYLSLKFSYVYGTEFIFTDVFAFGNYKDYESDDPNKSNLIWDCTMDKLDSFGISFDPDQNPKNLIGYSFHGIVSYEYDAVLDYIKSNVVSVQEENK